MTGAVSFRGALVGCLHKRGVSVRLPFTKDKNFRLSDSARFNLEDKLGPLGTGLFIYLSSSRILLILGSQLPAR